MNDYGQTDVICDLFDEIEKGYLELSSIFDKFSEQDIILAFFPCTEFEDQKNMQFLGNAYQQTNWSDYKKLNYDLYLHKKLSNNYELITKLVLICLRKNLRLIIENPKGTLHYLSRYWALTPKIIDTDRRQNGDYYKKPTQFWFINCEPKNNIIFEFMESAELRGTVEDVKDRKRERSEISPQYAERFIKQFIADYDGEKYTI